MHRLILPLAAVLALAFAAGAQAQMYRWVDKDGKVRYTDTPPPAGTKSSTIKAPPPAPAAKADPAAKGAAPATPGEMERDFRSRQQKARDAAEKQQEEAKQKADIAAACQQAREYIATLRSGQRVSRTDAKGERYTLDDAQTAQEIAREEQQLKTNCK